MKKCQIFGCDQNVEPIRAKGAKSEPFTNKKSGLVTFYFPLVDDPENNLCPYHTKCAQGLLSPILLADDYPRAWHHARLDYLAAQGRINHDEAADPTCRRPSKIDQRLAQAKALRASAND